MDLDEKTILDKLAQLKLSADDVKAPAAIIAFLDEEREAAVLGLRKKFLAGDDAEPRAQEVAALCAGWLKYISSEAKGSFEATKGLQDGVQPSRLIKEDVPRTFATPDNRVMLLDLAVRLQQRLGDYSQAMLFVQAFFVLFLSRQRALELTVALGQSSRLVGARWWDRVAFGTEAFCFVELLATHEPEVAAHFAKNHVLAEGYTQKWFLAVGVNVLPVEQLVVLMDAFLEQGAVVLHRMGLAIVKCLREKLLAAPGGQIIKMLGQPPDDVCGEVVRLAVSESAGIMLNTVQLEAYRQLAADKYRDRLVPKAGDDSTRKHTGETDSEDGSEEDSEDNPECLVCHDNMADRYCAQCQLLLCNRCHKKEKKDHKTGHATEETEDWDWDRLVELFLKLKQ